MRLRRVRMQGGVLERLRIRLRRRWRLRWRRLLLLERVVVWRKGMAGLLWRRLSKVMMEGGLVLGKKLRLAHHVVMTEMGRPRVVHLRSTEMRRRRRRRWRSRLVMAEVAAARVGIDVAGERMVRR